MHWIDWLITIIPVLLVLGLAVYCRRYIRGVADYLAAGRVAGRYVMCVAGLESALGVTMVVATSEAKYQTGFAMDFWANLSVPIFMIMGLTGFCFYRFRETKALSMGQFLEMRYSKSFRVLAATVRTTAEMACNAIGPAITANFFIYFLGIPHKLPVGGVTIPTFSIVVGSVLVMAIVIMWFGGRLSLMVTDCVLGLLSYPIFVLIVVYVLWHFSWSGQISPTMGDRVAGESFLNPFKMQNMRDFNIFAVAVGIFSAVMNRPVWVGNDGTNAGRTPHEQKMSGILATWRQGFSGLLTLMVAIAVITLMGHQDFATDAKDVRINVTRQVADEVVPDKAMQERLVSRLQEVPVAEHRIGVDAPYSADQNADTPYMDAAHDTLGHDGEGNATFQSFKSLYRSMMMPLALRKLMPVGLTGLFCLMMLMMFLATDTSRMFNSSSTLIQDIVLPLRKTPLEPEQHVRWLRWGAVGVAAIFFVCSMLFRQMDFIWMFQTIVLSVWLGGAGVMMVGGLYTRFGNTVGAYAALIVGAAISVGAIIVQNTWAAHMYPWLDHMGWVPAISSFMDGVTRHTEPWIVWKLNDTNFPINSIEISLVAMLAGIAAYVIGSLVTYKGPFNLERMLHRGQYQTDGQVQVEVKERVTWRKKLATFFIGITPECTRGDRILIWSVFIFSIVYQLGICFILVAIWNSISVWPDSWWSHYFYVTHLLVPAIVGVVSTVWFLWGGIIDTRRLFRDLAARVDNPLDDGRVHGHVSTMDAEKEEEEEEVAV